MTLTPAYGRDYKSKKAVLADFDANKDFMVNDYNSSGYTTKEELVKLGVKSVQMRYNGLRQVFVYKVQ